ncbi:MAG: transglutaminase domain-containing protein, partial [Clostridia bacterium]|nr:transglutaminase domain-containing protein [Clostridia bacterium]
ADAAQEQRLDIKTFTTDYLLPYFIDMKESDHVIQSNDVSFSGTHDGEYSVYYYVYDGDFSSLEVDLGELREVEALYRAFVYSEYLTIDTVTEEFILGLIEEKGWSKDDPDIVRKVRQYVQNCATYNLFYDPNLDKEENMVVAFLGEDYNEGVCRHYASAATMIFRALGIPARYTIGYVGNTAKDKWTKITSDSGHAWTEIYLDGIGWIPVEVTGAGAGGFFDGGGLEGGEYDDLPEELEISPIDVSKEYDGTPLVAVNEIKIPYNSAIERLLSAGFTYEVVVEGSQTEIGVSESHIVSFKIFNSNGKNVTDRFKITYNPGEVRVTKTQVIIVLYDIQKTYDGTPLSYAPDDYWIKKIPEGYTLEFKLEGSLTEPGEFDVKTLRDLPYILRNEKGEDVTEDYYLEIEGRGLRVNRRILEFCSASAKKEYTGEKLADDTITITLGSLVSGHELICQVTGSITDVGKTKNTVDSYIIKDKDGKDVTGCYETTCIEGILEIVKGSNH